MDAERNVYGDVILPLDSASEPLPPGGERLLHYVWQHRLWQPARLFTTDGKEVEVIHTGRPNIHAGPDFSNATVRHGGMLWAGNIEIHFSSADWYTHGHDKDPAYDNVVLHVCCHANREVVTSAGISVPQVEIRVPDYVQANYERLLAEMEYPPCFRVVPNLSPLKLHAWLDKMGVERLEQKTLRIEKYLETTGGDWERVFFIALSRAFGFGVNAEAFEHWASNVPLSVAAHHRDDLFQVEALFYGQAGMLSDSFPKQKDAYWERLRAEYAFLRNKFGLTPMDGTVWKFLRMRPQNFPTIRMAQLAALYVEGELNLSAVIAAADIKSLTALFAAEVSNYWHTHYTFGRESTPSDKRLRKATAYRLLLNAVCPVLFAYGRYVGKEEYCERAFAFLEQLPPEDDHIVRRWAVAGVEAQHAADSQALNQLYSAYCQRKDCLRCAIGREYLRF